nr:hypothetical protein CFP56_21252 [Quercus suber]
MLVKGLCMAFLLPVQDSAPERSQVDRAMVVTEHVFLVALLYSICSHDTALLCWIPQRSRHRLQVRTAANERERARESGKIHVQSRYPGGDTARDSPPRPASAWRTQADPSTIADHGWPGLLLQAIPGGIRGNDVTFPGAQATARAPAEPGATFICSPGGWAVAREQHVPGMPTSYGSAALYCSRSTPQQYRQYEQMMRLWSRSPGARTSSWVCQLGISSNRKTQWPIQTFRPTLSCDISLLRSAAGSAVSFSSLHVPFLHPHMVVLLLELPAFRQSGSVESSV